MHEFQQKLPLKFKNHISVVYKPLHLTSNHYSLRLSQPKKAHVLGGYSIALPQGYFNYHYDKVLHFIATEMFFADSGVILLYDALPGMWQVTLSLSYNSSFSTYYSALSTAIYKKGDNLIAMF